MTSRRAFLAGMAGSAACMASEERRDIPIALQLFSVRKQCAADLPGTLARVKRIGFTAVELAGNYGRTAAEFRQFLDDNGLICCGAHVGLGQLRDQQYAATVAYMHALGNKRVIVPGLPATYTQSLDGWRAAALVFAELLARLAQDGLELGYHNHSIEFQPIGGVRPIDVFLRGTKPAVFLELDLGGAGYGGANPVEVLETYRQRVKMIHVKDYTIGKPDLMIGTGSVDWPDLIRDAQTAAVEWYVVEHDSASGADLGDIADSYDRFSRLLATGRNS